MGFRELAFLEDVLHLLHVVVPGRLFVRREVLLDVGSPCLEGGHADWWILTTFLDDVEGLLDHLLVALLGVPSLETTSLLRGILTGLQGL